MMMIRRTMARLGSARLGSARLGSGARCIQSALTKGFVWADTIFFNRISNFQTQTVMGQTPDVHRWWKHIRGEATKTIDLLARSRDG